MNESESDATMKALLRDTVVRLRAASGSRESIVVAIKQFLDEGMKIVYSPSAMWDFFGPLPRKAGYNERDTDRIMRIFSTVVNEVIMGGRPYPPDWPWFEEEVGNNGPSTEPPSSSTGPLP
ncbi:MAG: hypothetical protein JO112_11895 [Planctomycetes bacterium]|nr:hypothetical protein [Planctomycetota bacterium]